MKTRLFVLIIFSLFFSTCKDEENKKNIETPINIDLSELKLDNDKKWIANLETHDGVKNMYTIIKKFQSRTDKDYIVLSDALSKETSVIIEKCSMKGEPHDQLHVVLVPMLDEISVLKETNSNSDSKKAALAKLEFLMKKYFEHFNTQ